jgi:hypothetical protein
VSEGPSCRGEARLCCRSTHGWRAAPQIVQQIDEHTPAPQQRRLPSLGFKCVRLPLCTQTERERARERDRHSDVRTLRAVQPLRPGGREGCSERFGNTDALQEERDALQAAQRQLEERLARLQQDHVRFVGAQAG